MRRTVAVVCDAVLLGGALAVVPLLATSGVQLFTRVPKTASYVAYGVLAVLFFFAMQHRALAGLRKWAYFAAPLVVIALGSGSLFAAFVGVCLLVATLVERRFPREDYGTELTTEKEKNLGFYFLRNASYFIPAFIYDLAFADHTPTWGMVHHAVPFWLQVVVAVAVLDFVYYWVHRGQHGVSVWWHFHKMHHAQRELSVFAAFRTNLFDLIFMRGLSNAAAAWLIGADSYAVLLYGAFRVVFIGAWSHANVDFPPKRRAVPLWAYVLTTPSTHATHHETDLERGKLQLRRRVHDLGCIVQDVPCPGGKRRAVWSSRRCRVHEHGYAAANYRTVLNLVRASGILAGVAGVQRPSDFGRSPVARSIREDLGEISKARCRRTRPGRSRIETASNRMRSGGRRPMRPSPIP